MILRRGQRHEPGPVGEDEVRRFGADEKLLQHDRVAGITESTIDHRGADGGFRFLAGHRDHHAFARRKTVGLEHDRIAKPLRPKGSERSLRRRANQIVGGRDLMPRHEILREGFTGLQGGRRPGRADDGEIVGVKEIGDAEAERTLGTDHGQVHGFTTRNGQQLRRFCQIGLDTAGKGRDPRIPGGAHDLGDVPFSGQLPGDRVFTRATADHENLHRFGPRLCDVKGGGNERSNRTVISLTWGLDAPRIRACL